MGLYEVPLSMPLLGFVWHVDYDSQRPYEWYYVGVNSSLKKRVYVF